jgi:hypothetical protein
VALSNGNTLFAGEVFITDMNGREVFYKRVDGEQPELHISMLAAGSYLVRYQGDDDILAYERLIIVD